MRFPKNWKTQVIQLLHATLHICTQFNKELRPQAAIEDDTVLTDGQNNAHIIIWKAHVRACIDTRRTERAISHSDDMMTVHITKDNLQMLTDTTAAPLTDRCINTN